MNNWYNGFENYMQLAWVMFLCIMGGCIILFCVSSFYNRCRDNALQNTSEPQDSSAAANVNSSQAAETSTKEDQCALEMMGEDSVYRLFMGTSFWGWGFALTIVAAQFWMCFVFVEGSEFDFSNPTSDLEYLWECPRDNVACRDTDGKPNRKGFSTSLNYLTNLDFVILRTRSYLARMDNFWHSHGGASSQGW